MRIYLIINFDRIGKYRTKCFRILFKIYFSAVIENRCEPKTNIIRYFVFGFKPILIEHLRKHPLFASFRTINDHLLNFRG